MIHCAVCQIEKAEPPPPGWITLDWLYVDAKGGEEFGDSDYCGTGCLVRDWREDGTIGQDIPVPVE